MNLDAICSVKYYCWKFQLEYTKSTVSYTHVFFLFVFCEEVFEMYFFFQSSGELNEGRSQRKREQIENMISSILPLIKPKDRIVEFCAGGGHLGIVLAYLFPDCQVRKGFFFYFSELSKYYVIKTSF